MGMLGPLACRTTCVIMTPLQNTEYRSQADATAWSLNVKTVLHLCYLHHSTC